MLRARVASSLLRARPSAATAVRVAPAFARASHSEHGQETFESFTERYVSFFQGAQDLFEVQRGLNNCFAHDLVPSPAVVEAAVRAARRVNDYATAVRIFEGIKEKVENTQQYQAYLECANHAFSDPEASRNSIHSVEERFLVFLQIFVICRR